jgi:hypothetical protein
VGEGDEAGGIVVDTTDGLAIWSRVQALTALEQALHGRHPSHINSRKFDWTCCAVTYPRKCRRAAAKSLSHPSISSRPPPGL